MNVNKAVITNSQNQMLVFLRDENSRRYQNCWDFFGCPVNDDDDTCEQTLAREIKEQLNLDVSVGSRIGRVTMRIDDMNRDYNFWEVTVNDYSSATLEQFNYMWTSAEELKRLNLHDAIKYFLDGTKGNFTYLKY